MLTFSNPRLVATFPDWPIGGSQRGGCVFTVHHNKRGWRVERRTTDRNGQWCQPKYTTHSGPTCIVDGDDGRTYILEQSRMCDFITVIRSDFMNADYMNGRGAAFPESHPAEHAALLALIAASNAAQMPIAT